MGAGRGLRGLESGQVTVPECLHPGVEMSGVLDEFLRPGVVAVGLRLPGVEE